MFSFAGAMCFVMKTARGDFFRRVIEVQASRAAEAVEGFTIKFCSCKHMIPSIGVFLRMTVREEALRVL